MRRQLLHQPQQGVAGIVDARLHLGDCLDVMRAMPDGCTDCIIADPPYGARPASERFAAVIGNDAVHTEWLHAAARLVTNGGAVSVFSSWSVLGDWSAALRNVGLRPRSCIVWDKVVHGLADPATCWAPQHEMVSFAAKGRHILRPPRPHDVLRIPRLPGATLRHPYKEPAELMTRLQSTSLGPGDTVLDPLMGSGATGVACVQTGRNFIGIEIDPGYFGVAERRTAAAQAQLRLPPAEETP